MSLYNKNQVVKRSDDTPIGAVSGIAYALSGGELGTPINLTSLPAYAQPVSLSKVFDMGEVPTDGGAFLISNPGCQDPEGVTLLYVTPEVKTELVAFCPWYAVKCGPFPAASPLEIGYDMAANFSTASVQGIMQSVEPLTVQAGSNDLTGQLLSVVVPTIPRISLASSVTMRTLAAKGAVVETGISDKHTCLHYSPAEPTILTGNTVYDAPTFISRFDNTWENPTGVLILKEWACDPPDSSYGTIPQYYNNMIRMRANGWVYGVVDGNSSDNSVLIVYSYWAQTGTDGSVVVTTKHDASENTMINPANNDQNIKSNLSMTVTIIPPFPNCTLVKVSLHSSTPAGMGPTPTIKLSGGLEFFTRSARLDASLIICGILAGYKGSVKFTATQTWLGQPTAETLAQKPDENIRPMSSITRDLITDTIYDVLRPSGSGIAMSREMKLRNDALITTPGRMANLLSEETGGFVPALGEAMQNPDFSAFSWKDVLGTVGRVSKSASPFLSMYNPAAGAAVNALGDAMSSLSANSQIHSAAGRYRATPRYQGARYRACAAPDEPVTPRPSGTAKYNLKAGTKWHITVPKPPAKLELTAIAEDDTPPAPAPTPRKKPKVVKFADAEFHASGKGEKPTPRPSGTGRFNLINRPLVLNGGEATALRAASRNGAHPVALGFKHCNSCMHASSRPKYQTFLGESDEEKGEAEEQSPASQALTQKQLALNRAKSKMSRAERAELRRSKNANPPVSQAYQVPVEDEEPAIPEDLYEGMKLLNPEEFDPDIPDDETFRETYFGVASGMSCAPVFAGLGPTISAYPNAKIMSMGKVDRPPVIAAANFLAVSTDTKEVAYCTVMLSPTQLFTQSTDDEYIRYLRSNNYDPDDVSFDEEIGFRYDSYPPYDDAGGMLTGLGVTVHIDKTLVLETQQYLIDLLRAFPQFMPSPKYGAQNLFITIDGHSLAMRTDLIDGDSLGLAFMAALMGCPTGFVMTGRVEFNGQVSKIGKCQDKTASFEGDVGREANLPYCIIPAGNIEDYTDGQEMFEAFQQQNYEVMSAKRLIPIYGITDLFAVFAGPLFTHYANTVDPDGRMRHNAERYRQAYRAAVTVSYLSANQNALELKQASFPPDSQKHQNYEKLIVETENQIEALQTKFEQFEVINESIQEDLSQVAKYEAELVRNTEKVTKSGGKFSFKAQGGAFAPAPSYKPGMPKARIPKIIAKQEVLEEYKGHQVQVSAVMKIDPAKPATPDNLEQENFVWFMPEVFEYRAPSKSKKDKANLDTMRARFATRLANRPAI